MLKGAGTVNNILKYVLIYSYFITLRNAILNELKKNIASFG